MKSYRDNFVSYFLNFLEPVKDFNLIFHFAKKFWWTNDYHLDQKEIQVKNVVSIKSLKNLYSLILIM